jgi:cytochrome c-type biogenesis protein CcmE
MKTSHIIGIVIIAVAIAVILSSVGDASTYVTFKEAKEMAKDGSNKSIHVVGSLKKDAQGNIVGLFYDPMVNANHFEFTMVDSLQNESKVVYNNPKPADLEKSEKVVIVGSMKADYFQADQILLKCPSKYNNNKLEADSTKKTAMN